MNRELTKRLKSLGFVENIDYTAGTIKNRQGSKYKYSHVLDFGKHIQKENEQIVSYNSKQSEGINRAENLQNAENINENGQQKGNPLEDKEPSPTDFITDSIAENVLKSNEGEKQKKLLEANDASLTTNIISISENLRKSNDFLNFSENSIFYTKENGKQIEYKKPTNKSFSNWLLESFRTDEKFPLSKKEEKFLQILKDVQLGKIYEGIIGDGKYGKICINTETTDKIFQKHGPFYLENLVATANNWDYVIENRGGVYGKINFIKQFTNNKGVILAGNIDTDGVFSVTFYEPKSDLQKLLTKEADKGGIIKIRDTNGSIKPFITKIRIGNEKGSYNSTSSYGVSTAENRTGDNVIAFKLSNRIREVIEKMGTQFTRYTNVGAIGDLSK